MEPQYCKNKECDRELDVFLANQYDGCCTPLCAMRALRQSMEIPSNIILGEE